MLPPFNRGQRSIPRIQDSDDEESENEFLQQRTQYQPLAVRYCICISDLQSSTWKILLLTEKILIFYCMINIKSLWMLFPIYFVLAYCMLLAVLYKTVKMKFQSKYYDVNNTLINIMYIIIAPSVCILTDLYIFTFYTFCLSDLSESRYITYYFNAKAFLWTLFASLPTFITICLVYLTNDNNAEFLGILILSSTAFINNVFSFYLQKRSNNLSLISHIRRYYLLRDTILPYKEAIISNRIEDIRIHEPLTHVEWRKLVDIFQENISIKKFNISFQTIPHDLFQIVFESLLTNGLTEIHLVDCNLFAPLNQLKKSRVRLSAIAVDDNDDEEDSTEGNKANNDWICK